MSVIWHIVCILLHGHIYTYNASLVAQMVKSLPTVREPWVLGQEDPLEEEMATQSRIPARIIPGTEEPGRLPVHRLAKVGHDLATKQQQVEK